MGSLLLPKPTLQNLVRTPRTRNTKRGRTIPRMGLGLGIDNMPQIISHGAAYFILCYSVINFATYKSIREEVEEAVKEREKKEAERKARFNKK